MKTTAIGLILAMLLSLQPYLDSGEVDFKKNWLRYLVALAIGAFGYFAQDRKKSNSYREGDTDNDTGGGGIKNPTKP